MSRAPRWLIVVVALVLALLSPVAFAAAIGQNPPAWVPTPLVNFAFDVRLTTAPLAKKVISLSRGSLLDKRIYVAGAERDVRFQSGNVQLVGSVYGSDGDGQSRPGVLLLHGSTPEGRRMGLYRILSRALAERGYAVLAIDQRGFGQSPSAADPGREDAFDYVGDAMRALNFLATLPGVDPNGLNVIGHSFGVGIALNAGLLEPRARSVVVIGPGAPGTARPMDEVPVASREEPTGAGRYFARRAQRYGSAAFLPGVNYIGQPRPLEALAADELARSDHKPLLIVSDEYEPSETLAAIDSWQSSLAGPSRLLVAPRADHYLNTAGFGRLVIYDVRAVAVAVGEIDVWLGGSAAGCAARGGCAWPGVSLIVVFIGLGGVLVLLLVTGWRLNRRRSNLGSA